MVMLGTTLGSCKKDEDFEMQPQKENSAINATSMAAAAYTVYIDPTYSGTKKGTVDQPYTSFSDVSWVDGGAYLLKRGTVYRTSSRIRPNANNITIGAYGTGNRPLISSSVSNDKVVDLGALRNVTVQDLEIESTNHAVTCFHFFNSVNGTLINCKVHGSTWGIRNVNSTGYFRIINTEVYKTDDDGVFISNMDSVELAGSYIHDVNQKYFINQSESYSGGDCYQLDNVKAFNIHDNTIDHGVTGNKFCIISNSANSSLRTHGRIERNTLTRNGGGILIYLDQAENILIRDNKFKNADIAIYNHSNAEQVISNEFINIKDKVLAGGGPNGANTRFFNNTFYNVNIIIQTHSEVVNFQNNVLYKVNKAFDCASSYIKPDYNCYYQSSISVGGGSHSITTDPQFNNASSLDFTLKSSSPCINKGTTILRNYTDMLGVAVPYGNITDMGAHEYNGGVVTTTPPSSGSGSTGQAPTVSITSPSNGTNFKAPAYINITASASDADGSISKVEFFNGTTKIGEKTTSPYTINWQNVPDGSYQITAVATDNTGLKATSKIDYLYVNNVSTPAPAPTTNILPTVTLTSPSNGQNFKARANFTLSAAASDPDGKISKVEFYNGSNLIGVSYSSPYTIFYTGNLPDGNYKFTAVATDNAGGKKTSSIAYVYVNN
jgi:hypothetical protein